jgi:glutamine cyclotransferase
MNKSVLAYFFLFFWAVNTVFSAPVCNYRVIRTFPHDPIAFCQGLIFTNGFLYESTGLYGQSSIRKADLKTGRVIQKMVLPKNVFGEGLALSENKLIQLSWREKTGFVRNLNDFKIIKSFSYDAEGWGLTSDQSSLIMSDGSSVLTFLDPKTFSVQKRITVQDNGKEIQKLNELEYVSGQIYANVWGSDSIAVISPNDGNVLFWVDFSKLLSSRERMDADCDVLNGIAFDKAHNRLFVTGKNWPKLFEIKITK